MISFESAVWLLFGENINPLAKTLQSVRFVASWSDHGLSAVAWCGMTSLTGVPYETNVLVIAAGNISHFFCRL